MGGHVVPADAGTHNRLLLHSLPEALVPQTISSGYLGPGLRRDTTPVWTFMGFL